MQANVVHEWIAFELFDAQGDALFVHVDGQDNGFHFLTFFVVAQSRFRGFLPRQVRHVYQTVDTAF